MLVVSGCRYSLCQFAENAFFYHFANPWMSILSCVFARESRLTCLTHGIKFPKIFLSKE